MKEKYYKVSESELMDLLECRERFNAVYKDGCEGGIVGWEWYGDCLSHYREDIIEKYGLTYEDTDKYENGFDYWEMADILIKNYEEIKND